MIHELISNGRNGTIILRPGFVTPGDLIKEEYS